MTVDESPLKPWRPLLVVFFASGMSGLIYESIWSRYIRQLVGSAATAQILVLALYMGGLSIGALLAARWLGRIKTPVAIYGVVEGFIGVYALAFPHLFEAASSLCQAVLFPAFGGGWGVAFAKWGVASLIILPPCILLGTTFPLLSVGILRRDPERSGKILSGLYFANSLGASMGALLSGFGLVPLIGLPGALMVAAAINLLVMLLTLGDREAPPPMGSNHPGPMAMGSNHQWMVGLYLAIALGTGLSSFMYEVGWIRLLSMVLGSATHSFEVMLSAFILGLALGGFWIRNRMDKLARPEIALAIIQLLMGMSAITTLPMYLVAVQLIGWLMEDGERTWMGWYVFNVLRYLCCLLIMLPATFCAGMTLPLLTHVMLKRREPESVVGRIYGFNTMGAILGALAGGLLLMPWVRLKGVIVIGALIDMLLGLALIQSEIRMGRGNALTPRFLGRAAIGTVFVTIAGLLFPIDPTVLTATVFRYGRTSLPSHYEVVSYADGRTASVTVVENTERHSYHIIYTNGKPDASVILDRFPPDRDPTLGPDVAGDEPNQFLIGLLPLMAKPEAVHGALIGFGSGVTCHTLLGSPVLQRLETVEIEPEMVRGARFFLPVNYRAYQDERNHFRFDDARAYFASAGDQYDFIVSEPTNPWVNGVSSLFTIEFYRDIKHYLKPDGILAQWVQGYDINDELLVGVLAAIDQEFADYLVIRIGTLDWVILSSVRDPIGPLSEVPLHDWPDSIAAFETLGIHDIGQIDGLITANRTILHPFLEGRRANSDAFPILDTGAEATRFMRASSEFLHLVHWTPAPILEVLGGIERRRYPEVGIGDLRDPHILHEPEQAMLLMRWFADPATPVPTTLSSALMSHYREATDTLEDSGTWHAWTTAVYEIYRETAPHFPVHESPWWQDVKRVAARPSAPSQVVLAIELLDALSAKDADRLWPAAEQALAQQDFPLSESLCSIAGLVALELMEADFEQRRDFAERWMKTGDDPFTDSGVLAYEVIKAYALRP